jgi:hypothetical protein
VHRDSGRDLSSDREPTGVLMLARYVEAAAATARAKGFKLEIEPLLL